MAGRSRLAAKPGGRLLQLTIDGIEFCWTLSRQGIADPLAGLVHLVPRRVAGPIVIDLDTDGVGPRRIRLPRD
jgi:hypothetical protein